MSWLILLWVLVACAGVPTPTVPADTPTTGPRVTPAPLPAAAQKTEFPPIAVPPDNLTTPARSELGRQLFYDPVLSANKTMSCATCHHPDQGLANGQATSTPRPGAPARNVPTLWNVGYNRHLLWDGRETSLESQARQPLTLPNEMAADPDQLVADLRAIPAYVELFDAAYGGGADAITFDNVTRALAAFQRTLISQNSPFDRYVAGDGGALTAAQQRGLDMFFSERTHCAECHQAPTFASETFRVVGVASDDPGRAGVSDKGLPGAFKVPTLRNVALTAPYMHNGSLASLEEVVQFYADGAGRPRGVERVDPLLKGFELSAAEKADLIAFLEALTDESALPAVPERAVSGLQGVGSRE
jgi:cytochrome c peroxidase